VGCVRAIVTFLVDELVWRFGVEFSLRVRGLFICGVLFRCAGSGQGLTPLDSDLFRAAGWF
jgi:hypothetical protein